jgi:hypothetical protein
LKSLNKVLVFFILIFSVELHAKEINYNIWIKAKYIKVEFSMIGDKTGKTEVRLPFGFSADTYPENDDIQIYLDGKLFKKIKKLNSFRHEDYIISLKHRPYAKICIIYNLHNSEYHYPYLYFSKNGFFLEGEHTFIIPNLAQDKEFDIKISLPEYKRSVISNLGNIKNHTFHVHSNLAKFPKSFLTGGDISDIKLYPDLEVIFLPSNTKDKEQIIQFFSKVRTMHNQFFNDHFPDKKYLVLQNVKYMDGDQRNVHGTIYGQFYYY